MPLGMKLFEEKGTVERQISCYIFYVLNSMLIYLDCFSAMIHCNS